MINTTKNTPIAQNQIFWTLLHRLNELKEIISQHRSSNNIMALIMAVCLYFGFFDPKKQEQQQTTYHALLRLHDRQLIDIGDFGDFLESTPKTRKPKILNKYELPRLPAGFNILEALNSVRIVRVTNKAELLIWNSLIEYFHLLGCRLVGRQIKYVFYIGDIPIAAIGFASPAKNLQPREDWIKWSKEERYNYLHYIIYMARFAICDELKDCEEIKANILAMTLSSISADFYDRYKYEPMLVETFVEQECDLANSIYKDWEFLGMTKGRGRSGTPRSERKDIKQILIYTLVPDFRIKLNLDAVKPLAITENLSLSQKLSHEIECANIDARLQSRFRAIMAATLENPGESSVCAITSGNIAAMAAYYRFIANQRIDYQILIAPHVENTVRRTRTQQIVLCLTDTCIITLTNLVKCSGLGYIGSNTSESENREEKYIEIYTEKLIDTLCLDEEVIFEDEYDICVEEYFHSEIVENEAYDESNNVSTVLDSMNQYAKNLACREKGASYGIFSHSISTLTLDAIPLGIMRLELTNPQKLSDDEKKNRPNQPIENKKNYCWIKDAKCIQKIAAENPNTTYIQVGDREMEFYEFHAEVNEYENFKYVTRIRDLKNTRIEVNDKMYTVEELINILPEKGTVVKTIARKSSRPGFGREEERQASEERVVEFSIKSVEGYRLPPKNGQFKDSDKIPVNIVIAAEKNPKPGEEPLLWALITNLPVSTFEQSVLVLDAYIARWNAEVKYRNDKTTFMVEKLNCDDVEKMKNAITIRLIASWYTMYINRLSRVHQDMDADVIFDGQAKNELAQILGIKPDIGVEPHIGLYEAVCAIAKLAGYTNRKCDPHPGDQLFGKGLKQFFIKIKEAEGKIDRISQIIDQTEFLNQEQKEILKQNIAEYA